jgi:DNA-directed RNA polymerase subunit RPC12/RpoP
VKKRLTYIWCPQCRKKILQVGDDNGPIKIRTKIVVFKAQDDAFVVCAACGYEVPVDISLGGSTEADLRAPRMILGRK